MDSVTGCANLPSVKQCKAYHKNWWWIQLGLRDCELILPRLFLRNQVIILPADACGRITSVEGPRCVGVVCVSPTLRVMTADCDSMRLLELLVASFCWVQNQKSKWSYDSHLRPENVTFCYFTHLLKRGMDKQNTIIDGVFSVYFIFIEVIIL